MSDQVWVPAIDQSHLREGAITLATAKGISIVLIKRGEDVYALRNRCAHMACTLAGGHLEDRTVRCPCHGWRFDIASGVFVEAPEIAIPTYACKSEGGQVWVKMEGL